ncbi:unnamed protein product [Prorocentrum cordatum]|uniref:Uncharacterized protein n=1 Tax=Prorocentrum cordatum TaxID=2364126 RepID=A0ABN9U724_9DINO|nr:unnamed protein product [Polarella glacialis]
MEIPFPMTMMTDVLCHHPGLRRPTTILYSRAGGEAEMRRPFSNASRRVQHVPACCSKTLPRRPPAPNHNVSAAALAIASGAVGAQGRAAGKPVQKQATDGLSGGTLRSAPQSADYTQE